MSRRTYFASIIAMASSCIAPSVARADQPPATHPTVVVELFTSEGCSSCPPADNVLSTLATPNAVPGIDIIPLALHVDYWNSLGWTDRFSSAQFSDRQQRYAQIFQSTEVYTPQMIVDGTDPFVGSDMAKARAAITKSATEPKGTITIALAADPKNARSLCCKLSVEGVRPTADTPLNLLIAVSEDHLSTDVPRGENAGQTLHHTAVVRLLRQVAVIKGTDSAPFPASTQITLDPAWQTDQLHIAAFVQDPQSGRIMAASYEPLHGTR
jgi:hypothetical protein